MNKWLIALIMLAIAALAASSFLLIPNIVSGLASGEIQSNADDGGKLGHVEFVPVDSMVRHDRVEVGSGVYSQTIDLSSTLDGSPSFSSFVVYANRIGPLGPGLISWKSVAGTPGKPVSVTLIEDGKSVWTSCFSPIAERYVPRESPTFEISGDSYLFISNNNDAQAAYTITITLVSK